MKGRLWLHLVLALTFVAATVAPLSAAPPNAETFIVVLSESSGPPDHVAEELAQKNNGKVGFVYSNALRGFSIELPANAINGIKNDPRVKYVEADAVVEIFQQSVPTGLLRTFADENSNLGIDGNDDLRVDVDVAVIDTGVDFQHPDLNVVGGVNCTGGGPFKAACKSGGDDDHYHGTHVAGTIGALDNGIGVVGVAPGARIWSVKVLNSQGSGYTSWIVAGIDWVASRAGEIEVANMSLGGLGYSQAEYEAIQGAVNKGVAFAVAAGNSSADANGYSPAAFNNVLTVSALADFDGAPGGEAEATCRGDVDDTNADFSNWGGVVDIAAPGVCITSTYPIEQGEYGTISGTSMASPHVAGALALLASKTNPNNATDVGKLYTQAINSNNTNLNWTDNSPDQILEPLLALNNTSTYNPTMTEGGGGEEPPPSPPPSGFSLNATGFKDKGIQHANLSWSGATKHVDIFRNGTRIVENTDNDGAYVDNIGSKGGGSYTYQVCETGSSICSNEATVTF